MSERFSPDMEKIASGESSIDDSSLEDSEAKDQLPHEDPSQINKRAEEIFTEGEKSPAGELDVRSAHDAIAAELGIDTVGRSQQEIADEVSAKISEPENQGVLSRLGSGKLGRAIRALVLVAGVSGFGMMGAEKASAGDAKHDVAGAEVQPGTAEKKFDRAKALATVQEIATWTETTKSTSFYTPNKDGKDSTLNFVNDPIDSAAQKFDVFLHDLSVLSRTLEDNGGTDLQFREMAINLWKSRGFRTNDVGEPLVFQKDGQVYDVIPRSTVGTDVDWSRRILKEGWEHLMPKADSAEIVTKAGDLARREAMLQNLTVGGKGDSAEAKFLEGQVSEMRQQMITKFGIIVR